MDEIEQRHWNLEARRRSAEVVGLFSNLSPSTAIGSPRINSRLGKMSARLLARKSISAIMLADRIILYLENRARAAVLKLRGRR